MIYSIRYKSSCANGYTTTSYLLFCNYEISLSLIHIKRTCEQDILSKYLCANMKIRYICKSLIIISTYYLIIVYLLIVILCVYNCIV